MNANMNQKSAIQIVAEVCEAKKSFFENLTQLNEKFNIRNNVFACDSNGYSQELKTGYYGEVATYGTIDEAAANCNILLQGVRVHDGKFSVGNLYANLSDVKEDLVIDLANSIIL